MINRINSKYPTWYCGKFNCYWVNKFDYTLVKLCLINQFNFGNTNPNNVYLSSGYCVKFKAEG